MVVLILGSVALLFHGVKHHDFTTMMKLLEEDPCRVSRHDSAMKNLLIISSQVRFTKGVRYLLRPELDTPINFRDLGDRTALWHACRNCDLVIAKLLLNAGADPTLLDANDLKPVDMIPEGDKELRSLLKEVSAKTTKQDSYDISSSTDKSPDMQSYRLRGSSIIL